MNQVDSLKSSSTATRVAIKAEQLKSWLPVDAVIDDGQPAIEWMDLGDVDFSEPFFHETLSRVNASGRRKKVVTDFNSLLQLEKISDSLQPAGFIFHVSRCGSTLLANACRALKGSVVMAEAPIVDKIVSRFFTDAEPDSPKELLYMLFLKGAISALGQRRGRNERHYFVKFACTSTLQMSRIRRVWPNVPFMFLYRDPVQVIESNLKSNPEWMRPESNPATAAAIVGVPIHQMVELGPEEFCARALGRFFAEANANRNALTTILNYDQLTPEMLIEVVTFFGIDPDEDETDAIGEVSRLYSKDLTRSQTFHADSESKRASASAYVVEMAEKWALPAYERLSLR